MKENSNKVQLTINGTKTQVTLAHTDNNEISLTWGDTYYYEQKVRIPLGTGKYSMKGESPIETATEVANCAAIAGDHNTLASWADEHKPDTGDEAIATWNLISQARRIWMATTLPDPAEAFEELNDQYSIYHQGRKDERYSQPDTASIETTLAGASDEAFAAEAKKRDYYSSEDVTIMTAEHYQQGLEEGKADHSDVSNEGFAEEARNRGYYRPGEDDDQLEKVGYYTTDRALEEASDWDFAAEAEERDYHSDEDYDNAIEEARQKALEEADDDEFEEEAQNRGYYKSLEEMTEEQLLEELNRRNPAGYMTADQWSTQAREDMGWLDADQVDALRKQLTEALEQAFAKAANN